MPDDTRQGPGGGRHGAEGGEEGAGGPSGSLTPSQWSELNAAIEAGWREEGDPPNATRFHAPEWFDRAVLADELRQAFGERRGAGKLIARALARALGPEGHGDEQERDVEVLVADLKSTLDRIVDDTLGKPMTVRPETDDEYVARLAQELGMLLLSWPESKVVKGVLDTLSDPAMWQP